MEGNIAEHGRAEWEVVVDVLRRTDRQMYMVVARKLLNHLFVKRIKGGKELFGRLGKEDGRGEVNMPTRRSLSDNLFAHGDLIFRVGRERLGDGEMMGMVEKWIREEKSHYLEKALVQQNSPIGEVTEGVRRYYYSIGEGVDTTEGDIEEETSPVKKGIRVALIRRFLTEQLEFINTAKNYCRIRDFYDLLQRLIFPAESHGKVGGKSAGLFLAYKVIERSSEEKTLLGNVKVPKTWYITSDGIMSFIYYNNLEEVIEEKYKDIDEIREEYPHMIQAFKNSEFPPELKNGLSRALDDLWENPIIVRSSSLLEDRMGTSFSGKYKSLFLANQGTKQEKLDALTDAIAEVYASVFAPDPIEYRAERGLLDFHEEMGIMIQEVVGTKVGKYYFPAFAGVAFSNNEFRWSPRIKREDGLVRIVPGLGTRAVDRLSDDYPVLVSPGQPNLRINISPEELRRYSPKKIDVINLETNDFESILINTLLDECSSEYPLFTEIFSVLDGTMIRQPGPLDVFDHSKEFLVTFDGLIAKTNFLKRIDVILKTLQEKIKTPVDIEFAYDGKDFYMLQCRPQSYSRESNSESIPKDVPEEKIVFTAHKFISNGRVPDISHIVYVDPQKYSDISDRNKMLSVGRAISKLNKALPKRKFILIGPGRWGSKGDIKLGVSVIYSDLNNTAMLIEVARTKSNYVPELSFGTHFFQDLVEAGIRYLPLYPDDAGVVFNENFLNSSPNIFCELVQEYNYLEDTIKVIDVISSTGGSILKVLMNAEL